MLLAGFAPACFFPLSLIRPASYGTAMQVFLFISPCIGSLGAILAWSRKASAALSISLADSGLLAIFNFPSDPQKLYSCSLSGNSLICCDAYEMASETLLPRVG